MPGAPDYDVFLSHSARDKGVVRKLAERLRAAGLRVWFDEWEVQVGDSIMSKVEDGLERSRVLVLCMSKHAFGSDWAALESQTFRFRDPLNRQRRFIPVRLDAAEPPGSLGQFHHVDWRGRKEAAFQQLLAACTRPAEAESETGEEAGLVESIQPLGHTDSVKSVAFSPDGRCALSGSADNTVRVWDIETGQTLRVLEGHSASVSSVAWSGDGRYALSGSADKTVRMWEVETGRTLRVFKGHIARVWTVAWSGDGRRVLSGSDDKTVRVWDVESGHTLRVLKGHTDRIDSVVWSSDAQRALSGSGDKTVRVWDVETGQTLRVLDGHTARVVSVAWSSDGSHALSGSEDKTVRVWDTESGQTLRVLHGHTDRVLSVVWSKDNQRALSSSDDKTVRVWDVESGLTLRVLRGHSAPIWSVAWRHDSRCALSGSEDKTLRLWDVESGLTLRVFAGHSVRVLSVAWTGDGRRALSGSEDNVVRVSDLESGHTLHVLEGHTARVWSVAWSDDGCRAISGSHDNTVRIWEAESGHILRVLEGHTAGVNSVVLSSDGRLALSGSDDSTVRVWDVDSGRMLRVLTGHTAKVWSVAWSHDNRRVLSGSADKTVRIWDVENEHALLVLEGHTDSVWSVALSIDGKRALSGSADKTVRVWDAKSGRTIRMLEGHTDSVWSIAWSNDGRRVVSGSADKTARVWDVNSGRTLQVLKGHTARVWSVAWSIDGQFVFSAAANGTMRKWHIGRAKAGRQADGKSPKTEVIYTNAKVLLVGDSGVGKSGLSNFLAHGIKVREDRPLPSTDGAWATHWPLPRMKKKAGVDREIWLWDFAGQVDYRLVHQLYMDDTAAAVLVFNPQNENPFDGLGHWDRDLHKATRKPFAKLLVAGRVDRGGLVVSKASLEKLMAEREFRAPFHQTSAKTGAGCAGLREAIEKAIDWKSIPETTSPALYHRMKQEILGLRDSGMILIRQAELKQRMEMALSGESFKLEELDAVVSLLSGPGMIQRLNFGGFILLRPEVLNRYAAAVVRKVRKHPQELGCIREADVLAGRLDYQDFARLENQEDEAVILRALDETFVSRAWCLRQGEGDAAVLTFPSYFLRERPEKIEHPSVVVTYRFAGPVDEIYATLVVRLHHTEAFETDELWRYAADFKTQTGKKLGLMLTRETEGAAKLEIHFSPEVDADSRVVFRRYVHNHLMEHARDVVPVRHYFCQNKRCQAHERPYEPQAMIDAALAEGGSGRVFCGACGKPIVLRDEMEKKFESPQVKEQAREMAVESQTVIDAESKELILVGHAFAIAGEAGQIYRGYTNSDHGLDGEIEFKTDKGRASGKRLYLQLKSGDSYLTTRSRDGAEIFRIKNPRWATYWQEQAYPVLLVIRTSDKEIRWMDVSAYLRKESAGGKRRVTQVVFEGERFDALSVRRWRDRVLGGAR